MPIETLVTRCGNCGAALQPKPGASLLTCAYCRQTTYLAPTVLAAPPAATHAGAEAPLHARLMAGPLGEVVGRGTRYGSSISRADAVLEDRAMWPTDAKASSTFGGSWSPSTLLGVPRVFPRCGDLSGAWAPGPNRSTAEWVELTFPHEVPASAVRVFETNRAGSTYAVVDVTGGAWQLLWAAPPGALDDASILEVAVSPPRVIHTLRVYVVNPGWAELDTVGLVAAQPLPDALRTREGAASTGAPAAAPGSWAIWVFFAAIVLAVVVASAVFATRDSSAPRAAAPARPSSRVPGAVFSQETPEPAVLLGQPLRWASAVIESSSEFSSSRNAARDIVGAPDVYPNHGDLDGAWASHDTDAGEEWITVRFAAPVMASAVLWVETLNPGAVVRVDDVSTPGDTAVLWEGVEPPAAQSVVSRVTLPAPRLVSAVRLVLDTRRVAGWNEIDAVALSP